MQRALAAANPEDVEEIIRSTGFFRAKTKSLIGMATAVVERYGGEVPTDLEDLVTIPGVGRKTGNVVRSVAFGLPGLPVDTHVLRVSERLGLTVGLTAARTAGRGQGRARAQRSHSRPPSGVPSACGSSCTGARPAWPATPLRRMPSGRLLPLGTVIGVRWDFRRPF